MTDVDHCYCVLLNAHDGAAFPSERKQHDYSPANSSKSDTSSGKVPTSKVREIDFLWKWIASVILALVLLVCNDMM